jgi:hypothetical protein
MQRDGQTRGHLVQTVQRGLREHDLANGADTRVRALQGALRVDDILGMGTTMG